MGTLAHRGRERARGTAPIACLLPLNPQAEQYLHARPYSAGPRGPTRRKEDGEIAAFAQSAGQRDLTAEQADQLAAYGEAEAGATVDARGGAVALGE